MSKDFRKLYVGVQIFKHYFEDTGLQRYPLSTKDFCIFFFKNRIINLKSTIFFVGSFFTFLGIWTGRVQTETNKNKKRTLQNPRHKYEHFI